MRVVIAGGGLAGLALAVGLARDGCRVLVCEADESLTSRPQGYRIHLDSRGLDPLRSLLPAAAQALVEQTCGVFEEPRRLEVLTGRLRHLRTIATGPSVLDGRLVSTAVDRTTLRAILAAAAVDAGAEIRWNTTVTAHRISSTEVEVIDGSGHVEPADLLVGADGARSRIASQVIPGRLVRDTGAGSIVGRSPIGAASPRLLERLDHGYVVLRGLRTGVGLGLVRFATRPEDAGRQAGVALGPMADYVMWNVGVRSRGELETDGPEALQHKAIRRTRGWHHDVRRLISAADPQAAFLAPVLIAERPEPWPASRVTVIGDAAHVMPPDRGSGANLALADAARLRSALSSLSGPDGPDGPDGPHGPDGTDASALVAAVQSAERAMVEQAFAVSEAGPATDGRAKGR